MKDKLIEVINDFFGVDAAYFDINPYDFATHLISNGVVLQEDYKEKESNETTKDLELVNQYTRRPLTQDEVYIFSIVLCDNDIDRDYERFTVESLYSLEKLCVGKTGIINHNNQTARIISCSVEPVEGRKNAVGEDYFRLVAKAYMVINDTNKDLILDIDKGNLKEVSVGCAVEETRCSICGKDINSIECTHRKGKIYNGKICYGELINPMDAYEWSFVAIPTENKESNDCVEFEEKVKNIVKQAVDEIIKTVKTEVRTEVGIDLCEEISNIPAADVVEVIRCKDCRYYIPYPKPVEDFDGHCDCYPPHETDENEFCSYGVRRV